MRPEIQCTQKSRGVRNSQPISILYSVVCHFAMSANLHQRAVADEGMLKQTDSFPIGVFDWRDNRRNTFIIYIYIFYLT